MGYVTMSHKLDELDRLVNDPNALLDAARVWDLLDELSSDTETGPQARPQPSQHAPARLF